MNTEVLSNVNCDSEVAQDTSNIKQNIIWFDGEVCIIYIIK